MCVLNKPNHDVIYPYLIVLLLTTGALASPLIFNYERASGDGGRDNLQVKAAEKTLKHPTHSPLALQSTQRRGVNLQLFREQFVGWDLIMR